MREIGHDSFVPRFLDRQYRENSYLKADAKDHRAGIETPAPDSKTLRYHLNAVLQHAVQTSLEYQAEQYSPQTLLRKQE